MNLGVDGARGVEIGTATVSGQEAADLLDGWDASGARKPQKRSVTIAGHRTSVSLEETFWRGLKRIAASKSVPVTVLIAAIDSVRGGASLSSAIRLFVYQRKGFR